MKIRITTVMLLGGCFRYSAMPPERPAPELRKLADAKILEMSLDLNKQKGLCPGQEGKLYAHANVQWPEGKAVARTIGSDVDSLAPSSFAVTGSLLTGDKEAHLHPSGDVAASADTGFVARVVYTPIPKWSFDVTFPPEYSCFHGWWDNGGEGGGGYNGDYGGDAQDYGQRGGNGGNGTPGNAGAHGGRVVAYVTFASTKFHPKLLAVIANDHFFLAPPDVPLSFGAAGGPGGTGGSGGGGGGGGNQATETVEEWDPDLKAKVDVTKGVGPAGNGGNGGNGARGGRGGDGGTVEVIFDSRFPELQALVQVDVRGGAGGGPGNAGAGGAGGESNAQKNQQFGNNGGDGNPGDDGAQPGNPGRARVSGGSVQSRFAGIRSISISGGRR